MMVIDADTKEKMIEKQIQIVDGSPIVSKVYLGNKELVLPRPSQKKLSADDIVKEIIGSIQ